MRQRLAAWAVTGPPGHLVAWIADFAALLWGSLRRSRR
jgi:hypothetical protein